MLVNGAPVSNSDTASIQGADVAPGTGTGQFNRQSFWESFGFDGYNFGPAGPWKWDDSRKLPGLK